MADKINSADDIKVSITKDNGEVLVDGTFCTTINISLNSNGEIASSFFGAYNKDIIVGMEKAQKMYFKELKKQLKSYNPPEEIEVKNEEISNKDKWVEEKPKTKRKNTKRKKDIYKDINVEEKK